MKEKMPKKSGRWWFWRKRADSTIKQVITYILIQLSTADFHMESDFSSNLHVLIFSLFIFFPSQRPSLKQRSLIWRRKDPPSLRRNCPYR